jgi:hypothetical protein
MLACGVLWEARGVPWEARSGLLETSGVLWEARGVPVTTGGKRAITARKRAIITRRRAITGGRRTITGGRRAIIARRRATTGNAPVNAAGVIFIVRSGCMSGKDYLPAADQELDIWALSFYDTLKANYVEWGLPDPTTSVGVPVNIFHKALEAAHGEYRGPRLTQVKNQAKAAMEAAIRDYVMNNIAHNKNITGAMRVAMGLNPHDGGRSPNPTPTELVEVTLTEDGPMRARLDFKVRGSANRRRPDGCNGAVMYIGVGDKPAAGRGELHDGGLVTRTPRRLHFTADERGKFVSVSLCWQSTRGDRGTWSDIQSVRIP